jgi:DNA-binding beta-propeller fold protein YncE
MPDYFSKVRKCVLPGVLMVLSLGFAAGSPAAPFDPGTGDILIADQFNNRVIEVDPNTHQVIWQFGDGSDKPGPTSIVGVNDAERIGPYTLMSGTGIPAATPALPGCSTPATGCPDNRVIIVNNNGKIVWQYGQDGWRARASTS